MIPLYQKDDRLKLKPGARNALATLAANTQASVADYRKHNDPETAWFQHDKANFLYKLLAAQDTTLVVEANMDCDSLDEVIVMFENGEGGFSIPTELVEELKP